MAEPLKHLLADKCEGCISCNFSQRLLYVMEIYLKYDTQQTKHSVYEIITDVVEYNITSLLNDYHHWKHNHLDETDHYQHLFEQMSRCTVMHCNIIKRNERKRVCSDTKDIEKKSTKLCDTENAALSETLDSIHSTMFHQYDLFKISHTANFSKPRHKTHKLLNTAEYQQISSFIKSRAPIIKQLRSANGIKNKFVTKTFNNNYDSKIDMKTEKDMNIVNKDHVTQNDGDDLKYIDNTVYPIYHFGFCYSPICCNEYHDHSELLEPKYKNLKEEIISNKVKNISLERWDIEYCKAKNIQKTSKSKSNMWFTRNIMSVLLYCNIDELQYHFSEAFRLKSTNDTKQATKRRYIEFIRWAEKLRETVYKYGRINKKTLFHGISEQMLFNDASAYFYSPTSTTIDPVVAHYFSTNDGIIIKIDSTNNRCLDCSWLSNFEYEKEYLFMDGYIDNGNYQYEAKLRISGLIDCKTGITFDEFLNAINFLNDTFFIKSPVTDHLVTRKIRHINQNVNKSTAFALNLLLKFRIKNKFIFDELLDLNDDGDEKIDETKLNYIHSIFDCYCNSKTEIIIEPEKYKYLTQLLMGNKHNKMDLRLLVEVFPNLETICFSEYNGLSFNDLHTILELICYGPKIKKISTTRGTVIGLTTNGELNASIKKLQKQLKPVLWTVYSFSRDSEISAVSYWNNSMYGNNMHLKSLYTFTYLDSIYVYHAFVPNGSKYALYKVNVCQGKEERTISKRYSEFHRVYEELELSGYHSKCKFPSKIWGGSSKTEEVMKHRLCGLSSFIQEAFNAAKAQVAEQHNYLWLRYILVFADCYVQK